MPDLATLISSLSLTAIINVIGIFWLRERLRLSIQHEYSIKLESAKKELQSKLQQEQQVFSLGAMSHMATTAFDKHVEFSEKYLEKVLQAFHELRTSCDSKIALSFAGELTHLRFKYAAWLTENIDKNLSKFESKLRILGANSEYVDMPKGEGTNQEDRDNAAREMLSILSAFISWNTTPESHKEAHIDYILKALRDILGTSKLVDIRERLLSNAGSHY